jgi:DNA (cytosine-5)-methyltransferase 1
MMSEESKSAISLFSGAMGLDLGLEMSGLDTAVCIEQDEESAETIHRNRPNLPVINDDIRNVDAEEITETAELKPEEVFLLAGGPPCVTFSSGGNRGASRDAEGSLFEDFLRVAKYTRPTDFLFENVANIVTAAIKHRPIENRPGKHWNLSSYSENPSGVAGEDENVAPLMPEEQAGSAIEVILNAFESLGYKMVFFVLNAADYGVPQHRLRLFIIGSRTDAPLSLPNPTHGPKHIAGVSPWPTLREAISSLEEPLDHPTYSEGYKQFFSEVPPGGNWRDMGKEMQKEAMGGSYDSGGGKTGFFRRLGWNKPSPTVTQKPNRKSAAFCHPDDTRPLAVEEWARIQSFPDDWEFAGGTYSKYSQIGNAAPCSLGKALGKMILQSNQLQKSGRSTAPNLWSSDLSRSTLLDAANSYLREFANPHREHKPHVSEIYDAVQTKLV